MKRVALYTRVSSSDQHTETQLCDLRPSAAARGYQIVGEYTDTISGTKAKRPGLDKLMADVYFPSRLRCLDTTKTSTPVIEHSSWDAS
jgi:predicted site-specific integrase-resolvase